MCFLCQEFGDLETIYSAHSTPQELLSSYNQTIQETRRKIRAGKQKITQLEREIMTNL